MYSHETVPGVIFGLILSVVGAFFSPGLPGQVRATTYTACRNGWLPFNGNCYWFGHTPVHFTEAEQYCRQHNSHLVEVGNFLENAFIKDWLAAFNSHCHWIGISDETIEGVWMWSTSKTRANFTDWYHGEPDNGDCAAFWKPYGYKWGDYICTNMCSPLCQTKGISGQFSLVGRR